MDAIPPDSRPAQPGQFCVDSGNPGRWWWITQPDQSMLHPPEPAQPSRPMQRLGLQLPSPSRAGDLPGIGEGQEPGSIMAAHDARLRDNFPGRCLRARQRLLVRMEHAHFLAIHARTTLSTEALATAANLSPSRFLHVFNDVYGCSPLGLRQRHSILRAMRLLAAEPGIDIAIVGRHCGFQSPEHFSRIFAKHAGCPPSAYRSRQSPAPSWRMPSARGACHRFAMVGMLGAVTGLAACTHAPSRLDGAFWWDGQRFVPGARDVARGRFTPPSPSPSEIVDLHGSYALPIQGPVCDSTHSAAWLSPANLLQAGQRADFVLYRSEADARSGRAPLMTLCGGRANSGSR